MEQKKKVFYKRWWAWVIAAVILLPIVDVVINPSAPEATEQVASEPQDNGLSEATRKEIFKVILASERKAQEEADASVSPENVSENADTYRELEEQYASEIRWQYGVDENAYASISAEGVSRGWDQEYYREQDLVQ